MFADRIKGITVKSLYLFIESLSREYFNILYTSLINVIHGPNLIPWLINSIGQAYRGSKESWENNHYAYGGWNPGAAYVKKIIEGT